MKGAIKVNDSRTIFAVNLKKYTELTGKTQNRIAEEIGVSKSTFSDWIAARSYPRPDRLQRLASVLGVSQSDLTERTDGCVDGRIAQSEDIIALANDLSSDGLARMIIKDLIQLCDDDKQIILSLVHRLKK